MQKEKIIKATTIAAFTALYALYVRGIAAKDDTFDGINPMLAMLLHANVAHLAVNMYALWYIWRKPMWLIALASLIGLLGICLAPNAVGFSAALFALLGLQWHIYDCKQNRIMIGIMLLLSLIIPQLTFIAHVVPFTLALLINFIWRINKQYRHDTQRR